MDFLSINNNYYNGLMENTTNGMVTKKLTDSVKRAENTTDDEELMKACKSFESYMVEQIMSKMEEICLCLMILLLKIRLRFLPRIRIWV